MTVEDVPDLIPEPDHPEIDELPEQDCKEHVCLNCDTIANEKFCANCGQSTRDIRISFKSLALDFLGDALTFDSKLFRTIKPLILKPGLLTADFMEGKRIRYVPPLRLFIFSSLVFFVTVHYAMPINRTTAEEEIASALDGEKIDLESLNLQSLNPDSEDESAPSDVNDDPTKSERTSRKSRGFNVDAGSLQSGDTFWQKALDRAIKRQEARFQDMDSDEATKIFVNQLFQVLSKAILLLMPLFALMLKLLYVRRDPYYLDHLIFAFHYHAFLFAMITVLIWLNLIFDGPWIIVPTVFISIIVPLVHMFKSLRRVYGQEFFKTLVKFFVLMACYFGVMLPFAGFITLLAFITA